MKRMIEECTKKVKLFHMRRGYFSRFFKLSNATHGSFSADLRPNPELRRINLSLTDSKILLPL